MDTIKQLCQLQSENLGLRRNRVNLYYSLQDARTLIAHTIGVLKGLGHSQEAEDLREKASAIVWHSPVGEGPEL